LSAADTESPRRSDWKHIGSEVWRRTWEPFSSVPFVLYVVIAIIGFGCLGIWVELVKFSNATDPADTNGILTALATFYPALIGSASLQMVLYSTGRSDKILTIVAMLFFCVAFGSVVLVSVYHARLPELTMKVAIGFSVFAVWLWWIVNADDPTYKSVAVDAASGGDPKRDPKGTTKGFKE
jgi:hypothetical protein